MNVEIITTGEEVLSGQITDTNASWLSAELAQVGLPVRWRTTVGDRLQDLARIFRERAMRADVIIVNGGLGPTVDDLSSEAAGAALDEPLVMFSEWVEALQEKFTRMGRNMSPENLKQARLPQSAEIIPNPVGTACGFRIHLEGCWLYFTPGVPSEFKRMVTHEIIPDLKKRFQLGLVSRLRRLHCLGIAESRLDGMLSPIDLPEGVTLGYRAHLPTIEIKVMGLGEDEAVLVNQMEHVVGRIREIVGDNILCEEDHSMASYIQEKMIAAGHTLALGESCTGGMLSSMFVDIPGSSAYFHRGYVTYTNEAKHEMLGVDNTLFENHGAVSMEVAIAMAKGAQENANTSHALAISGIAGPEGGSEAKPVGTVAFALATPEGVIGQLVRGPNWGRTNIRKMASGIACDMLIRHLDNKPVCPGYDAIKVMESTED